MIMKILLRNWGFHTMNFIVKKFTRRRLGLLKKKTEITRNLMRIWLKKQHDFTGKSHEYY